MPRRFDGERPSLAGRYRHINIDWIGGDAFDGSAFAPKIAANDAGAGAVVFGYFRDFGRLHFLITGSGHLFCGGEIRPELKAVHPAQLISPGHLLMDDASARSHPLD